MIVTILFFALFQGLVSHAFTAPNVLAATRGGDGSGKVSGYDIEAPRFHLDESDPRLLEGVSFRLDSAPPSGSTVTIRPAEGGPWYSCSASGPAVTCDTTSRAAHVAAAGRLTVVVAQ